MSVEKNNPLEVVILAAGKGTRMRSSIPKVMHTVLGRPMLGYPVLLAKQLGATNIVVVTGHHAEQAEAYLADQGVKFARQAEQLGTGHAFLQAVPHLQGGDVFLLYGDSPLIRLETLQAMLEHHRAVGAGLTILTSELGDATGYGRIVRNAQNQVQEIVEQKSASSQQKLIREFNSGVYIMDTRAAELAQHISNNNAAGEYYITDILALYRAQGLLVEAYKIPDPLELQGANDRAQLAELTQIMQQRINLQHMQAGVTLLDPASIFIEDTVSIGQDSVIAAGVHLSGKTTLGEGVQVGPYSIILNSTLERYCVIKSHSVLEGAIVHSHADVGPFARLRSGTILEQDVHVGNFVEVKNSTLGRGTKAGHLSYLGDATVGSEVNVGAGTITANFDGINKHHTEVGNGVFIGSNTVLVAPVKIGKASIIAAGSAISRDIPEGTLGVARVQQENKIGFSRHYWAKKSATDPDKFGEKLPLLTSWLKEK